MTKTFCMLERRLEIGKKLKEVREEKGDATIAMIWEQISVRSNSGSDTYKPGTNSVSCQH